ncbi:type III secretion system export apparatus subunit SctU [Dokdonella sp. MW10]|uniref:type III secretion system export apparatus subunit SctU n=1 Tax=Dokdonella sp. MW10 TaxID=2992926 RepID=UPI003F800C35
MSGKNNDSGDRTEKPTPKKLKDARKDGDVHKSKELSSTVLVLVWLMAVWLLTPAYYRYLEGLFEGMFDAIARPGTVALHQAMEQGTMALLVLTVPVMMVAGILGLFTDYIQIGTVFAPKRVKPDISRLNPAEGIKNMFSRDNLVEVVKSIFKTAGLTVIFLIVLWSLLPQYIELPLGQAGNIGSAHWAGMLRMGAWTVFVFFFVSALDAFYQRFSFIKRLRMSRRDIRQESKESEGDPHIKGRRRQLHQEWSQQNMLHSVRKSSVVVTNPTHVAVALHYEPGETELPVVVAKGEDHEAAMIRKAAEEAGVPIMQNVALARGLNENVEVDDYVTSEFFQAVAEVLRWAEDIRNARDGK